MFNGATQTFILDREDKKEIVVSVEAEGTYGSNSQLSLIILRVGDGKDVTD